MMTQPFETYDYGHLNQAELNLYLYRTEQPASKGNILYLHGGGLVYGSAHDLPDPYVDQITQAGYNLVSLAYPLAPEVKLDTILTSVQNGIEWFLENAASTLNLDTNRYVLFGRSAGAYLAVQAASHSNHKPDGLWLFYGYHTLNEASFQIPSRHYAQYPKLEPSLIQALTQSTPLTEGPKETRFAMYLYYRQSGKWIADILPAGKKSADYSLSPAELKELPPAFLTASTLDPDVPYRLSKMMAAHIPNSVLETIESDEHDFDRTTTDALGKDVYKKALAWLDESIYTK